MDEYAKKWGEVSTIIPFHRDEFLRAQEKNAIKEIFSFVFKSHYSPVCDKINCNKRGVGE